MCIFIYVRDTHVYMFEGHEHLVLFKEHVLPPQRFGRLPLYSRYFQVPHHQWISTYV
jgi:hypothetical protein